MARCFLAALLCIVSFVYSAEVIAISKLQADDLLDSEIAALTDVLRSELSKTDKFNVMERDQVDEILKEQGFQQTGACSDASCAIEIGQLLAVRYMVLGRVGKVGETYTINIRLVDVGTGAIVKDITEKQSGKIDDLLNESIPIAARRLSGTDKHETKKKKGPVIAGVAGGVAVVGVVAAIILLNNSDEAVPAGETVEVGVEW